MKYLKQEEAKHIDHELIKLGYTVDQLVEIAGYGAYEAITSIIQEKHCKIVILIGPGNNGADGLVIARWLLLVGHHVYIYINQDKISDRNQRLLNLCINHEGQIIEEFPNFEIDFIIDAVFGYSFKGEIKEPYDEIVNNLKDRKNIISIDVPSGYKIDEINNNALFKPDYVVCMVAPKVCCKGLNCYVTRAFVPKFIFYDLDLSNFVSFSRIQEDNN